MPRRSSGRERGGGGGPSPDVRTTLAGRVPAARATAAPGSPELLAFFQCPPPLRRRLRTTKVMERCFVEVRHRTRPMVCLVNVQSAERIIAPSSTGLTWSGASAPFANLHKQRDITLAPTVLDSLLIWSYRSRWHVAGVVADLVTHANENARAPGHPHDTEHHGRWPSGGLDHVPKAGPS